WNGKGERRALTGLALDPDLAAVQLDELAGQGQAQAGALVLARVVRSDLAELLEDGLVVLGRDADAGVGDRDLGRAVGHRGPDLDAAPFWRELHRVRQQVHQYLLDLALVALDL